MHIRICFVLAFIATACGGSSTATESTATYEGAIASTDVSGGESIWSSKCAGCHTEAGGAYGPRVHDLALPPPRMRRQIREGSGRMPGFDSDRISAEDLEKLLAYLDSIHAVGTN